MGIALLSFKWLSVSGVFLILGAAVQPRMPRAGRWLLSVAAPLLCVWIVPMGGLFLVAAIKGEPLPHDFFGLGLILAWLLAPILLVWCVAALVVEAVKERRSRHYGLHPSSGPGDLGTHN